MLMSLIFGGLETTDDLIMISVIDEAYNSGVLIIAAAGNESVDFDSFSCTSLL